MSVLHSYMLCILLLLPGTGLKDWLHASGPNFRLLIASSSIALTNARTAESDKISPLGSVYSIGAAARLKTGDGGAPIASGLGYSALSGNLSRSLRQAGIAVLCGDHDPLSEALSGSAESNISPTDKSRSFVVFAQYGALGKSDEKIGELRAMIDRANKQGQRALFIVASPYPSSPNRLAPLLVYRPERPSEALATSLSTHTPGLVTSEDIAPTVASFFAEHLLGPSYGHPLTSISSAAAALQLENKAAAWDHQTRNLQCRPYFIIGLCFFLIFLAIFSYYSNIPPFAAAPLLCWTGFLMCFSANWLLLSALIVLAAPIFFSPPVRKYARALAISISLLTVGLLFADQLVFHGEIARQGALGFAYSEGDRYYGIGNEIMGIWLGALAIGIIPLIEIKKNALAISLMAVMVAVIGLPRYGAKAGGLVAGTIEILSLYWPFSRKKLRIGDAASVLAAAMVLAAASLALFSLFGHSHVSQAFHALRREGWSAAAFIIARKLSMNMRLAFHSYWALLPISEALGIYLAYRKIRKNTECGTIADRSAVFSAGAAALASALFNDAGIIGGGLCALYLWAGVSLFASRSPEKCIAAPQDAPARPS